MKNYICIDRKKAELTKEQLEKLGICTKPTIYLSENGEIAHIGDYEFIVLNDENDGDDYTKLLLKDTLQESKFGEDNNDYRESKVKEILDKFAKTIEDIIGKDNLITHTVDLIADDGLKDYVTINAKMSLLTAQMYRENVYTIDKYKLKKWWWLVTPYSAPTHEDSTWVKCVSPCGIVNLNSYYGSSGVRPFCIVKSCIFENK